MYPFHTTILVTTHLSFFRRLKNLYSCCFVFCPVFIDAKQTHVACCACIWVTAADPSECWIVFTLSKHMGLMIIQTKPESLIFVTRDFCVSLLGCVSADVYIFMLGWVSFSFEGMVYMLVCNANTLSIYLSIYIYISISIVWYHVSQESILNYIIINLLLLLNFLLKIP